MIALTMTREEALLLTRLIGHHVFGDGMEQVYDQLTTKLDIDPMVGPGGPFDSAGKNVTLYGDRPMVRVDG